MNGAVLNITRPTSFVAMLVPCKVFVDDQPIGAVQNGKTQAFEVIAGRHVVYIKRGFTVRSNALALDCAPDETIRLQITQNGLLRQFFLRYTGKRMAKITSLTLERVR